MARLKYNGLCTGTSGSLAPASLSGSHSNSTTTLTFNAALTYNGGTAVPTLTGSDYFMLSILDAAGNVAEIVKVTAYTSGGSTATVVRGQEGTSGVAHSTGVRVIHGPTAQDLVLVGWDAKSRTSGDISLNTSGWQNVDTNLDITLTNVQAGDVIEYMPSGYINNAANAVAFDVATIVGGSPVNYFGVAGGATDNGVSGWYCQSGVYNNLSGSHFYTLQSGDISSGTVQLRFRCRPANTTARALAASSLTPLKVWARAWRSVA